MLVDKIFRKCRSLLERVVIEWVNLDKGPQETNGEELWGYKSKLEKEWWEVVKFGIKGKGNTKIRIYWGVARVDVKDDGLFITNKCAFEIEEEEEEELEVLVVVKGKAERKGNSLIENNIACNINST